MRVASGRSRGLASLLRVHPGEGGLVALTSGLMLLASTGTTIGQSSIDALFFSRVGADRLPLMYVVLGAVVSVGSLGVGALVGRLRPGRLFVLIPAALAGLMVGARLLAGTGATPVFSALWVLVGLAWFLQGLFTWGIAGTVTDTRQAKRLYPLFAAGTVLGTVLGGVVTRPLAEVLGSENLLLLWAGMLLATSALGGVVVRGAGPPGRRAGRRRARRAPVRRRHPGGMAALRGGYRSVRSSPLMRWLALSTLLSSVLFASLYLPFSRAAAQRFPDEEALAGFFGLLFGTSTGAAFLVSVFVANRLFGRFGVPAAMLTLPSIYAVGFAAMAAFPSFAPLLVFRFVQLVWMQGAASTAWEAVLNVVPSERRDTTRAFLYGVPAQAGTALAGLLLLVAAGRISSRQLGLVGLVAALLAIVAARRMRGAYADALLSALREGRPQVFSTGPDESLARGWRDAASIEAAVAATGDPDPRVRRASAEILGESGSGYPSPLVALLTDPDPGVRETALRAVPRTGDPGALPEVAGRFRDPDPAVRSAAVAAASELSPADELAAIVAPALEDPDPAVRAGAAAAILRQGRDRRAREVVRALAASRDPEDRARAIDVAGGSGDAPALVGEGVADPAAPVRAAAARALGGMDPAVAVDPLVGLLGDEDASVRAAAAAALGRIGDPAVAAVAAALQDPSREEGALDALGELPLDGARDALSGYREAAEARAIGDQELASVIAAERDPRLAMLRDALVARARREALRAIRALALLGDRERVLAALEGLAGEDPADRATALESLEALVDQRIVRPLLRLWEPGEPPAAGPVDWLDRLLADPDPWIRDCAALVAASREGGLMDRSPEVLSSMERVLFLRTVPLFADLSPLDLRQVAAVAEERTWSHGETMAAEDEPGDELHVVVSGEVSVVVVAGGEEREVIRRGAGEAVGEMALLTRTPRMASLVAVGDVRTLTIARRQFEGILRERPETALAVIRELCRRLAERERVSTSGTPGV